jgi:alcohol dehydrogenase class IV
MNMHISEFGGLKKFKDFFHTYDKNKILLITGKNSFHLCGAKNILLNELDNENVTIFNDFSINPKIEDAIRGAELARSKCIDLIIAVGGGSVIDTAKLIKAFYYDKGKEIELLRGAEEVKDPEIPIIAVPTTAGSGSEATHFAVVYIGTEKYSLAAECLLPNSVILDGSLTISGNKYQKTCNALDAMSQAIESAWATQSTKESLRYSIESIELGWNIFQEYITSSCKPSVAQKMIEASNLAGKAINISKTTSSHAWSYAFTSFYDVPHGHAIWLTLPAIFEIHNEANSSNINDPRGKKHLSSIMNLLIKKLNLQNNRRKDHQLNEFLYKIGIESKMENLGIDNFKERENISNQINIERMKNNPVDLDSYKSKIFRLDQ